MIRPYKAEDKKSLLELFKLNVPKYFHPREVKDFEEYLQEYGDTYLTIEHDRKIVGAAGNCIKESDHSGRITWMFFHPDYTGLGLGRQAVEYCLNVFEANPSLKKLVVTTSQFAYKFVEKFSFKLIQITKDHWGLGLDLYLMEKHLRP